MLRRTLSAAVAGAALLAAFGCGGGGNDTSVSSGAREQAVAPAADASSGADASVTTTPAATPGLQTVTYQGVQFDVPVDWPVHDLAADPTTCVRFDVHAVYLGQPGEDMNCPSGLVGRADAVLVEPTQGDPHRGSQGVGSDAADVASATASGLDVQVASESSANGEVAADVPAAGVSVTLTYRDSDATAQQILQSFRVAS